MKKISLLAIAVLFSGCALFANKDLITTANQFVNMPEGEERCKLLENDLNLAASMQMFAGPEVTDQEVAQGAAGFQLMTAAGCYSELAIKQKDISHCEEVKRLDARLRAEFPEEYAAEGADAISLSDTCYMSYAGHTQDPSACDQASAVARDLCRMSADPDAQAAYEAEWDSYESEGLTQDDYDYEQDTNDAAAALEDARNMTSGDGFINQEVVSATLETNDLTGCLAESSDPDLCYDAFAKKFGKVSLCSKIVDADLKASCKTSVGASGAGGA